MATRRALLGQIALGLGVVACRGALAQPAEDAAYVGIETSARTGHSQARFLSASGETMRTVPLDYRAHGLAQGAGATVVFPRRPGNRFALIDADSLEIRKVVTAPPDRHFYGHGAFTLDGRHLVVTENNLDTLAGSLGVYDALTLQRVGQVDLPGSGPHEIVRDPSRDLFHVALGGLETHPDYGRTPLNLSIFQSQLVSYDFARGEVTPLGVWPGTEGVSLRHLAVDVGGRIIVGGQLADPRRGTAERVLWLCDSRGAAHLDDGRRLSGYVSSVACDGQDALISSKESNTVLRLVDGALVEDRRLDGASAVAMGAGITAASGYGTLHLGDAAIPVSDGFEFDNHGLAGLLA